MNEYREAARSYASLLIFVTIIVVGFVIDVILGGGVAHIWGWTIALVVVVGLNAIVVYAARSEKSLRLSADELRVGDELVARVDIAGLAPDGTPPDDADPPVLGWPNGRPRGLKTIGLRLVDGTDVLVPTRYPDRLRAALALDEAPAPTVEVRAATRAELADLPELDRRAAAVFRAAGYPVPDAPLPDNAAEPLRHAKAVFVAGRPPVGFVWIDEVDGLAHVQEIAVLPRSMRQGIGSRLLERACEWARDAGYAAITLVTYADVPWNAPFYTRRGFAESSDVTPELAALRANEDALGLDAVGRRIVMRRNLRPDDLGENLA